MVDGKTPLKAELALFGAAPVLPSGAHQVWPVVTDEERLAVARVLDRGILSGPFAPESRALEEEFARFVGAKHAVLTHCGTSALVVALAAAGVRAGGEVILPSYRFLATPLAVTQLRALPVFAYVDISPPWLGPEATRSPVTART